jgi:hypothetical protein
VVFAVLSLVVGANPLAQTLKPLEFVVGVEPSEQTLNVVGVVLWVVVGVDPLAQTLTPFKFVVGVEPSEQTLIVVGVVVPVPVPLVEVNAVNVPNASVMTPALTDASCVSPAVLLHGVPLIS